MHLLRVRLETASRGLRLALCENWYGSLGRAVIEPILFNTSDARTLWGTGLFAIGLIFGGAAVGRFFGICVIFIILRQESGSTPVLMDS